MPMERFVYQLTVRLIVQVLSGGAVAMGLGAAIGGPERFSSASLATARLVPGGVYTWSALIAVGGLIALIGVALHWRRRVVMTGLAWQASWYAFFDVSLWTAVFRDPRAGMTGAVVYLMLAVVCVILYVAGHELMAIGGKRA